MTSSDSPEALLPLLEHVRKASEFNRTTFLGHLAGIVVVEVIFAGAAPAALLVGWGGVFAALWLFRVWLALRFERNAPRTAQGLRLSLRAWQLGVLATGALWGAGAWLFLAYGGLMRELSLVLIVFTYCIASVPIVGAQYGIFTGFVLLVMVPTISRFVLRGDTVDLEFACVLSAAMGMTMFSGHNRRRTEEIAVQLLAEKAVADAARRQATELNRTLEQRVADGVSQLEKVGRLKRFFSPHLAELIVAGGADDPMKSHRREITVVFLDLRGFTAFTETADPEEVMSVLAEYHAAIGRLVMLHEGTLERFSGDGIMVFFNDPVPVADPARRAVRMAQAMQRQVQDLARGWKRRGYDLLMGVGIAHGFATIGGIGFPGRIDYGAIGTVTNLAARLCGEAAGGEILISQRVNAMLDGEIATVPTGELVLKGFQRPVPAFRVPV